MRHYRFSFPYFLQRSVWPMARPVLSFFLSLRIHGKEYLQEAERLKKQKKIHGVIFAVNHTSEIDPILIPASLSFFSRLLPMYYVAREKEFYKKKGLLSFMYGGLFFRIWGAYPARVGLNNYERSLENHIRLLEAGKSVCIFPEGRIPRQGETLPAKGGVAYLAHRTNAAIIPVAISGVYRMRFSAMFNRKQKAKVVFGKMIMPEELFGNVNTVPIERHEEIAEMLMERIRGLSSVLAREKKRGLLMGSVLKKV